MAEQINEEHFLFVAQDTKVSEFLNNALDSATDNQATIELDMLTERVGTVIVTDGETITKRAVTVHEVPTLIETFKSHNHINLIKAGDIGQAFAVHELLGEQDEILADPEAVLRSNLDTLVDMEANSQLPLEFQVGLTPPMVGGSAVFRKKMEPKPELVTEVEEQLLALMHGEAPPGWVIEDVAEVYLVDNDTEKGRWVPLSEAPDQYRLAPQQQQQQQPTQSKG